MSLIKKIQDSAVDSASNISMLLRQCKVLAFRLENEDLKKWVDQELNGYDSADDLPSYRIIHTNSKGHFVGAFGRELKNGEIPLSCIDERFRDDLSKAYCTQPISAYEALISSSKGTNFHEQWPADLVAVYADKFYQGMNCLSAWKEIPYGAVVSLVDVVKNRILNFALEIELADPRAGEVPISDLKLSKERVTNVFHNTIYGNVGNIAEGSSDIKQVSVINVISGDFESLRDQLLKFGIDGSEIKELKKAIDSDDASAVKENKRFGEGVKGWVSNLVDKTTKGLKPIAQNISADLITKAIMMYYGIQ